MPNSRLKEAPNCWLLLVCFLLSWLSAFFASCHTTYIEQWNTFTPHTHTRSDCRIMHNSRWMIPEPTKKSHTLSCIAQEWCNKKAFNMHDITVISMLDDADNAMTVWDADVKQQQQQQKKMVLAFVSCIFMNRRREYSGIHKSSPHSKLNTCCIQFQPQRTIRRACYVLLTKLSETVCDGNDAIWLRFASWLTESKKKCISQNY